MNKNNLNISQIKFIVGSMYCGCSTIFFDYVINKSEVFKVNNIYSCIDTCCKGEYQYYHFSAYLSGEKFTGDCDMPMHNIKQALSVAEKVIRNSDFDLNGLNAPKSSKK